MAVMEPYWLWFLDNRSVLALEAGSSKPADVGNYARQKWQSMITGDKKPYETMALYKKKEYGKSLKKSFFEQRHLRMAFPNEPQSMSSLGSSYTSDVQPGE